MVLIAALSVFSGALLVAGGVDCAAGDEECAAASGLFLLQTNIEKAPPTQPVESVHLQQQQLARPLPTPMGMRVTSGHCTVDSAGCVMSPNYPQNYDNNQMCTIRVSVNTDIIGQIIAFDFSTHSPGDKFIFRGYPYSGRGPTQQLPLPNYPADIITWTSDHHSTDKGWKFCPDGPWISSWNQIHHLTHCSGNEIPTPLDIDDQQACQDACDREELCHYYSYAKSREIRAACRMLQTCIPEFMAIPDSSGAVIQNLIYMKPTRTTTRSMEYFGFGYCPDGFLAGWDGLHLDLEACKTACELDCNCKAISFCPPDNNLCTYSNQAGTVHGSCSRYNTLCHSLVTASDLRAIQHQTYRKSDCQHLGTYHSTYHSPIR